MENIAPLISESVFRFEWKDAMHNTQVEICIPDLRNCEYSVWANWGPMYQFRLNIHQPVSIRYNGERVDSNQRSLLVESPMWAKTREELPLYIVVEDQSKNLLFDLFLNREFKLGLVDIYRLDDKVKLFQSLPAQSDEIQRSPVSSTTHETERFHRHAG